MTQPLSTARIGYAGYSADFAHPGDRRRFAAYAAQKGLRYGAARLDQAYDLVLLTHNGDLSGWTHRKRREEHGFKLVFELVDSYFTQTSPPRRLLKGLARRALGMDSRLSPDFLRTLIGACEAADAVICSTEEQRETIRRYNPNVFISFDYFGGDLGPPKQDYSRGRKLRLVWEGQSTTLWNLRALRGPLNALRDHVELHVVSDPEIARFFGRYGRYSSTRALDGIDCDKHFHVWRRESFAAQVTGADVGIIPIDPTNSFAWGKPENKLVLLWQLGMPVLTADTPAYLRAMDRAGLDMTCGDEKEWRYKLEQLIAAPASELERVGRTVHAFAASAYSVGGFLAPFDAAFSAAGFDPTA